MDQIRSDLLARAAAKMDAWREAVELDAPGVHLYTGPSNLDGRTVHLVITGITSPSTNRKTGDMLQSYILPDDHPSRAIRNGRDRAVCGDCKHRPASGGACYVAVQWGPAAVWRSFEAGRYPRVTPHEAAELLTGSLLRIGTWGDPAAVPLSLWQNLVPVLRGWTGYTHQWTKLHDPAWRSFLMASVDTPEERDAAKAAGWRTFRVRDADQPLQENERVCLASEHGVPCAKCLGCAGTSSRYADDFAIEYHGVRATLLARKQGRLFT